MVQTRLTEMFDIKYPIICGAMMWLGKPKLVAAVSNAGGMGTLTAAIYPTETEFRQAIQETRALTDKAFMVGVTILPSIAITDEHYKMYLRICAEERVPGLEVSGSPIDRACGLNYLQDLKRAGVKLFHKVGALRHAKHAEKVGYDGVYAAGIEEGGHPLNDDVSTMVLTPKLSQELSIPVITTGGIANGATMAAALTLGADGVMMASRFMATKDCQIHDNIKSAIKHAQEQDTRLVGKSLHLQCRGLKNELVDEILKTEAAGGGLETLLPLMSGKRARAAYVNGNHHNGLFTVGQSIGLIDDEPTIVELLTRMLSEAQARLEQVQRSLAA